MKSFLVLCLLLGSATCFAQQATCVYKSKSKSFSDSDLPEKITVTEVSKPLLKYEFQIGSGKTKSLKKCEIPHRMGGLEIDAQFVNWFRYAQGPHELDECKDGFVEVQKLRKNKAWKLVLQGDMDGFATAIFQCHKKPKFIEDPDNL